VQALTASFLLRFSTPGRRTDSAEYDAVAVATPLENAQALSLVDVAEPLNVTRPYQRTCVTFVCGVVDPAYFGLRPSDQLPTELLTIENATLPFTTLAVHATHPNGSAVYKMFSRAPVDDALLDVVFSSRHRTRRLDWAAAYPQLRPSPADATWPPFEVRLRSEGGSERSVLYVNAMESAVSCMETQLIAAKNAALRLVSQLHAARATQPH
jgi:prenylcysteine oxidase / farnesylcysteine lyase